MLRGLRPARSPAGWHGGAGRRVRVGQVDGLAAAAALLRPAAAAPSWSAASTCASWRWPTCAAPSGVVFEEAFLFSDTIAANIAYGRPDATEDEIRAAAMGAEADGVHRRAARRLRHGDRRARAHPVRRPAAAPRAGQGDDHRSAGAGARRRDQRRRPDHRGGDPRHAAPGDRGPDHHPDRPPALDPGAGRPDRRGRRRAGRRRRARTRSWSRAARTTGTCSAPRLRAPNRTRSDAPMVAIRRHRAADVARVTRDRRRCRATAGSGAAAHRPMTVARARDRRRRSGRPRRSRDPAGGATADRERLRRRAGPHGGGPAAAAGSAACSAPRRRPRSCWPRSTRCRPRPTAAANHRPSTGRFSLGRTLRPVLWTAGRRARPGRRWTRCANLLLPVLIRYGVDNGVSAGRAGGDLGRVRRLPGRGRRRLPRSSACRRWSPAGPARTCSTTCACANSRTCSGSAWTTTSARWPAGS